MNMLHGLDFSVENATHHIAVNIAVSMVTLLYSLLLIIFVFEPIVYILKKDRTL
jgi:flagellar motor component MotA